MEAETEESIGTEKEQLPAGVRLVVWLVVNFLWGVIGFFIWIPALVLGILLYVAGVFSAAFVKDSGLLSPATRFLRTSALLYRRGFDQLSQIRSGPLEPQAEKRSALGALVSLFFLALLALIFSAGFWLAGAIVARWLWHSLLG